jgi:hypothetical protein
MVDLPQNVFFLWYESVDPDGEGVIYDVHYCENSNFQGCPSVEVVAFFGTRAPHLYAGFGGMGLLVFAFLFGAGRRRRRPLVLAMLLGSLMLLSSCEWWPDHVEPGFPHDAVRLRVEGLSPNTTYYWKVVASDGTDSSESVVRSFTTR